jgi:hypothetical protein
MSITIPADWIPIDGSDFDDFLEDANDYKRDHFGFYYWNWHPFERFAYLGCVGGSVWVSPKTLSVNHAL